MAQNLGGYNCKFVKPLKEIDTECPICLHILREPYLVGCCGRRFCCVCLENVESTAKDNSITPRCPICNNENLTKFPDKLLERKIKGRIVYCQFEEDGCPWRGELKKLDVHLNMFDGNEDTLTAQNRMDGCAFAFVKCTYCKSRFQRQCIEDHEEDCPQKPVTCEHCNELIPRRGITTHYDECPSYPVPCQQDCGETVKRNEIEDHIRDVCPKTIIKCGYFICGCATTLPRGEMEEHMQTNSRPHQMLVVEKYRELQTKVDTLMQENQFLKTNIVLKDTILSSSVMRYNVKSVLHVSNCPSGTNEQKLKALFGQHGKIRKVLWDWRSREAFIYYISDSSIDSVLSEDEDFGIKLHNQWLTVNEIRPNIVEN